MKTSVYDKTQNLATDLKTQTMLHVKRFELEK